MILDETFLCFIADLRVPGQASGAGERGRACSPFLISVFLASIGLLETDEPLAAVTAEHPC